MGIDIQFIIGGSSDANYIFGDATITIAGEGTITLQGVGSGLTVDEISVI